MLRKFVTALAIVGSIGSQAQHTYFLLDPPEAEIPAVKKIAVLDFGGERGKSFSERLMAELLKNDNGIEDVSAGLFKVVRGECMQQGARTQVFTIMERSEIQRVLSEQRFSNSGVVDESTAAELGRVLGLDAMIMGSTNYNRTYNTSTQGETSCKELKVNATVSLKVVDVTTGQVLSVKSEERTATHKACGNASLKSMGELLDDALAKCAVALAGHIGPHFKAHKFQFERIKVKEYSAMSKKAEDLLETKDLNGAYNLYSTISTGDPYNAQSLGNMANIHLIYGNVDDAVKLLERAAAIDRENYGEHLKFAQTKQAHAARLAAMGITITPHTFNVSEGAASMNTVTTRGNKDDRYEVRRDAGPGSEVIAKVPGGLNFNVVETKGEWMLIKLLDDKQGWINADDVKR